MAIPIVNFIDITSSVQGVNQVPTRNFGAMIITNNPLVPTGVIAQFTSANSVGLYFGFASEEYLRAVFYFGWVSKNGLTAQVLNFWFWNNDAATGSLIFGDSTIDTLTQFNAITTGDFTLTLGGFTHHLTSIDLSGAGSLAAVATDITTAINAYSAGGAAWTGAVVSYNATTGSFNLVSGATGLDTIALTAGGTTDLLAPLGWTAPGVILSNGTAAQLIAANLAQLVNISNNFGSICTTYGLALTLANTEAIANWNNSLSPNVQFEYSVAVSATNASTWSAALLGIGGTTVTLEYPGGDDPTGAYHEMMPMMIFAATNYNGINSVQNYKYQQFNATPTVQNQADYNTYTGLRVNFYGVTQTAGQLIAFYMNGYMMGLSANPGFQNLYANEIWFKDAIAANLLNLLLALSQIPANNAGVALITAQIQAIINIALTNGTISVGKTLNQTQQSTITELTGNPQAWYQVQNQGYVLSVEIVQQTISNVVTYTAEYTLVYSKDDVVQSITGSNDLI